MRRLTITLLMTCLLCLVPVSATIAQSPSPTTQGAVLGSGDEALAWLASMGIADAGAVATADGQLRWEATLPMSDVVVEFVGSLAALTSASLTASTGVMPVRATSSSPSSSSSSRRASASS